MKMKRFKSEKLSIEKQTAIGKFKQNNPNISDTSIAELYKCSKYQVRNAVNKYNSKQLAKPAPMRKRSLEKGVEITLEKIKMNPDEVFTLLQKQLYTALAQLEFASTKIDVSERVKLTLELTKSILAVNLRGLDMRIINAIFRHYEPDITDTEIVQRLHILKDKLK